MPSDFPPALERLNVTQAVRGAFAALLGEAHEYLVAGLLMRMGFLVSVITVRGGSFDIILPAFKDFSNEVKPRELLRVQVKTIRNSLSFVGGQRGGVDRIYRSDVKTYKYTTEHSDLIIGVDVKTLDLYFVPTRFIGIWGGSVSKNKLKPLKNNVDILLNWNESYLHAVQSQLGGTGKPREL